MSSFFYHFPRSKGTSPVSNLTKFQAIILKKNKFGDNNVSEKYLMQEKAKYRCPLSFRKLKGLPNNLLLDSTEVESIFTEDICLKQTTTPALSQPFYQFGNILMWV